ncbi:MAG: ribosome assembly RNA-binding protein YhbY [Solobacterium sp.]|jgi:RNA-binding protein|nr:ribosome assembly RNA-binding protein YhbY [Solobacterium sp.]HAE15689.1 ribosome assembly RNA-binding protein YhbY [Erysipelotrichaceae bacterium]
MLTGKQKRYLRSLAETQPAIFQIGKEALSDNLIDTVDKALEARELIKIRILKTAPEDTKELAFDLAMNTRSEIVQIIGRTLILYRRSREHKIVLP